MVKVLDRSLKNRVVSTIRSQQALQKLNGKDGYVSLETIYKILKAETTSEKAQIRGILNRDFINGQKTFERSPAVEGKKRSGAYRLHIEVAPIAEVTPVEVTTSTEAAVTEGVAA